jgi:hypothetical protein
MSDTQPAEPRQDFCLVLRREGDPTFGLVFRASTAAGVLLKAYNRLARKRARNLKAVSTARNIRVSKWSPHDQFISENYRRFGPKWVAQQLSKRLGKPVTKDMIIGRAHKLGLSQKRPT